MMQYVPAWMPRFHTSRIFYARQEKDCEHFRAEQRLWVANPSALKPSFSMNAEVSTFPLRPMLPTCLIFAKRLLSDQNLWSGRGYKSMCKTSPYDTPQWVRATPGKTVTPFARTKQYQDRGIPRAWRILSWICSEESTSRFTGWKS